MIFGAIREWSERRVALREISKDRRAERDLAGMQFKAILERAKAALDADQRSAALRLCQEINQDFPIEAGKSAVFFKILLSLHQYDDAERLITDGLARYPRQDFFVIGHARVADERGDIDAALDRWAVVRRKLPRLALGYARTAACLVKAGRVAEADAMLAQGIKQSPDDVFCLIEYARLAEASDNLEQALVRWQMLRDVRSDQTHPCYQNGTMGLAKCLRKMGRFDEAETVLGPFVEQFGVNEAALIELAQIAEARNDWLEALQRWQRVKRSFPMLSAGYRGAVGVLRKLERDDEADSVLGELADRLPDDLGAAFDYAQSAYSGKDKSEIARRWALVRERFPDCEAVYAKEADALAALGQEEAAAALRAEHQARFGG